MVFSGFARTCSRSIAAAAVTALLIATGAHPAPAALAQTTTSVEPSATTTAVEPSTSTTPVAPESLAAISTVRISQGERVVVNGTHGCTVGFNVHEERRSYIAAHCGEDGDRVAKLSPDSMTASAQVGTFRRSVFYDPTTQRHDLGWIEWDTSVDMGPNTYSGDGRVESTDLVIGDEVCFFGGKSLSMTPGARVCGPYMGVAGGDVFVDLGNAVILGDSGSPLWVPGKGFLAVVSGSQTAQYNGVPFATVATRGATNALGETRAAVDVVAVFADYEAYLKGKNSAATNTNTSAPSVTRHPLAATQITEAPAPGSSIGDAHSAIAGLVFASVGVLAVLFAWAQPIMDMLKQAGLRF